MRKRLHGPLLDLRLQAAAAQRALDAAVRIKERLGADLLRAGPLHARDDAERHRFAAARGLRQGLEDDVVHEASPGRRFGLPLKYAGGGGQPQAERRYGVLPVRGGRRLI